MSLIDIYLLALASICGGAAFYQALRGHSWQFYAVLALINTVMYVSPHLHGFSCTVTP